MKYTIILLFTIFLVACSKKDEINEANTQYPDFTCGDLSDDGRFENWTDTVEKSQCRNCYFPDSVISGEIDTVYLTSYRYLKSSNTSIVFYYSSNKDIISRMMLLQKANHMSYAFNKRNRLGTIESQSLNEHDLSGLQPGCARLYYYFTKIDNDTVITKGHFDIEVVQ